MSCGYKALEGRDNHDESWYPPEVVRFLNRFEKRGINAVGMDSVARAILAHEEPCDLLKEIGCSLYFRDEKNWGVAFDMLCQKVLEIGGDDVCGKFVRKAQRNLNDAIYGVIPHRNGKNLSFGKASAQEYRL